MEFESLHWLSSQTGMRYREVNFLFCQISVFLYSFFFRAVLGPSKVSATTRHAVQMVCGFLLGVQALGWEMLTFLLDASLCYILLCIISPRVVQKYVSGLSLFILSAVHIWLMIIGKGVHNLDCVGPLMILVIKVGCLAWSVHDGAREESELNSLQKRMVVRKRPSFLEYYSFVLYPQSFLVGPVTFYSDYIKFIKGSNSFINSEGKEIIIHKEPSCLVAVTYKVLFTIFCAIVILTLMPKYPIMGNINEDHLKNSSFWHKMLYAIISVEVAKARYFFVWVLADAINNAAGMGFNGYDAKGTPKWDGITNIDLWHFQFATSLKVMIDSWNKSAITWLRYTCFDRIPHQKTFVTFLVSCLWHGFFPGYFATFFSSFLMLIAARKVRTSVRPFFQGSERSRQVYDVLTWATTYVTLAYIITPFTYLSLDLTIKFFNGIYWWQHIVAIIVLLVLPDKKRKPSTNGVATGTASKEKGQNGQAENGTSHAGNGEQVMEDGEKTKKDI